MGQTKKFYRLGNGVIPAPLRQLAEGVGAPLSEVAKSRNVKAPSRPPPDARRTRRAGRSVSAIKNQAWRASKSMVAPPAIRVSMNGTPFSKFDPNGKALGISLTVPKREVPAGTRADPIG